LSSWDTTNVTNMSYMFWSAYSFNNDLSSWNVINVINYIGFDYQADSWTLPKPNFN